jgi:hypothetical protein
MTHDPWDMRNVDQLQKIWAGWLIGHGYLADGSFDHGVEKKQRIGGWQLLECNDSLGLDGQHWSSSLPPIIFSTTVRGHSHGFRAFSHQISNSDRATKAQAID